MGTPLMPYWLSKRVYTGLLFLGQVHLDHDKILVRLFHDVGLVEGDFIQGPAGGAPGGIEIDDHRLLRLFGFRQELVRIRFARLLPDRAAPRTPPGRWR